MNKYAINETIDIMVCITNIYSLGADLMKTKIMILSIIIFSFSTSIFANTRYSDVSENAWYAKDVLTQTVMQGKGDKFRPDDNVTRAELAVIINKLTVKIDEQAIEIKTLESEKFAVSDEQRTTNAVEKNKKSVVTVLSSGKEGAGFFVSEHLIVTSEHVLDTTDEVNIIPFEGIEVKGKILKRDFDNDLALIQIDGTGIPVTMNNKISVGETAIAIGHPFKYENNVTKGIVSFVNRSVVGRKGFATQIDTPINSGNSGGPLINLNGEVIGLVRSKMYSYKDGNDEVKLDGLGFAVRVEDIQDFIK